MSTWRYHDHVTTTRDRLIEAATALLDEGGPAAVTLREVGRLAGVSHNAPYKHFGGKEDLLAAVAARELSRMDGVTAPSAASAADGLRGGMHSYVRWAMRYPARFKLTFGPWQHDFEELGKAADSARAALVAAVESAQREDALPAGDPDRVAALILAAAHGAADLAISGHLSRTGKGHASAEDLVDDLLRHLGSAR
jgi:AcrR family transcriptional regulator